MRSGADELKMRKRKEDELKKEERVESKRQRDAAAENQQEKQKKSCQTGGWGEERT